LLPVSDMPAGERQRHARSYSVTSIGRAMAVDNVLEDSLRDMEEQSSCLLVLEVFNASDRQTFEVILESADGLSGRIKQKIEAGATANLLLPISRFTLPDEHIRQSIPSLSTKQFIVGKAQSSTLELELFWYREALLKNIKLAWRELGTRRTGQVNLQGLAFTDSMLPILRLEDLEIQISLVAEEGGDKAGHHEQENAYCVECGQFQTLHATIRNRSSESNAGGIVAQY
jgi:hypothetical protein